MTPGCTALDADCTRLGTILFTVTAHDLPNALFLRIHTNDAREYPLDGTKPLERDAWFDLVIRDHQPFVANTPEAFRALFFDHAQIEAMGLGSAANLPVVYGRGDVIGTVNLLAGPGHFTPERVTEYTALIAVRHRALVAEIGAVLGGQSLPRAASPACRPLARHPVSR